MLSVGPVRAAEPRPSYVPAPPADPRARPAWWLDAAVAVLLLVLTVALQLIAGAYAADMSVNPDEAGHLVSGLLVRDYLAYGLGESPVAFARDYYGHYPKVAIGNWPPAFYGVQGVWMLLFPVSRPSVLFLVACMTAAAAYLVFRMLRPSLGAPLAAFGAVAFLAPGPCRCSRAW